MPDLKADFCIELKFEQNSQNPARIFQAISGLIKDFEILDKDLVRSIDSKIEPVLLLEDIESGSVKIWLKNKIIDVLEAIPDEALKSGDYKKAIGHYLHKGKYIFINWLSGKTKITNKQEIETVQYELLEAAKETGINELAPYTPMQTKLLVKNVDNISKSLSVLDKKDEVKYISNEGEAKFNLELSVTPEEIEDLVTKESIESESIMILKVKKPDYLGDSMWEFKYDNRTIYVKISDMEWLQKFQDRKVDVRPKDAIRAKVKTKVNYDYDNSVIDTHYNIIQVVEVIENIPTNQENLFPKS